MKIINTLTAIVAIFRVANVAASKVRANVSCPEAYNSGKPWVGFCHTSQLPGERVNMTWIFNQALSTLTAITPLDPKPDVVPISVTAAGNRTCVLKDRLPPGIGHMQVKMSFSESSLLVSGNKTMNNSHYTLSCNLSGGAVL
jgi:hypothetical protein